jgi:hypothetical protein
MLEGNRSRVQNLTGGEIWLFILARVLIGFAVGILLMMYMPGLAVHLAWPALLIGVVFFVLASRGLMRKPRGPAA